MADTIDNTEVQETESTQAVRYINGKWVYGFIVVMAITIGGVTIYKKFWKEDTQKHKKDILKNNELNDDASNTNANASNTKQKNKSIDNSNSSTTGNNITKNIEQPGEVLGKLVIPQNSDIKTILEKILEFNKKSIVNGMISSLDMKEIAEAYKILLTEISKTDYKEDENNTTIYNKIIDELKKIQKIDNYVVNSVIIENIKILNTKSIKELNDIMQQNLKPLIDIEQKYNIFNQRLFLLISNKDLIEKLAINVSDELLGYHKSIQGGITKGKDYQSSLYGFLLNIKQSGKSIEDGLTQEFGKMFTQKANDIQKSSEYISTMLNLLNNYNTDLNQLTNILIQTILNKLKDSEQEDKNLQKLLSDILITNQQESNNIDDQLFQNIDGTNIKKIFDITEDTLHNIIEILKLYETSNLKKICEELEKLNTKNNTPKEIVATTDVSNINTNAVSKKSDQSIKVS